MRKRCAPLHLLSSSTRLWCVVELFCFLKNGGDIDRVTVLPVVEASNEADEAAADATRALRIELGRFRVERARCSQERDTQKLLGCIVRAPTAHHPEPRPRAPCYSDAPPPVAWQEAGFGKYESFNQVVRRIFSGRSSSAFALPGRLP